MAQSNFVVKNGLIVLNAQGEQSTSTTTGAIIVSGGIGVGENLNVGQDTSLSGLLTVQNTQTNYGVLQILNTASSTSSLTGAVVISGGVGIGADLFVGGNIHAVGNITADGNITLGDTTGTDTLLIGAEIISDLLPKTPGVYNIGDQLSFWDNVWANTGHLVSPTNSTGTDTGALIVAGGIGVGGDAYIGGVLHATGLYDNGSEVVTLATLGDYGVSALTAGTDTAVSTATGAVTIWNTSNLQTITDRGNTTSNAINITNTTSSTSTTTGALLVSGGAAVQGNIYAGGEVYSPSGSPDYNYQLYSPKVSVAFVPPTTASNRIGDFWIDPSIGVEYQWIKDGDNFYWIQFTGV